MNKFERVALIVVMVCFTICFVSPDDLRAQDSQKKSGGKFGAGAGGPGAGAGGLNQRQSKFGGGGMGASGPSSGASSGRPDVPRRNQQPQKITLTLKVYSVEDIVNQTIDRPFNGFSLPGTNSHSLSLGKMSNSGGGYGGGGGGGGLGVGSGGGGFGGGFGGGAGGGGHGGGGGIFSIAPTASPVAQNIAGTYPISFSTGSSDYQLVEPLIDSIQESIAPNSWNATGQGVGTIVSFGHLLVVSQTPEVHVQIETYLEMLRAVRANRPTVTVKAIWLTINEDQLALLDVQKNQQVNRTALDSLVKEFGRRGQITCFDGQTVHIASGNLKSSIESVVPVVGQNELNVDPQYQYVDSTPLIAQPLAESKPNSTTPRHVMAQVLPAPPIAPQYDDDNTIGYSPVSRWINYGTVLQLTPSVERNSNMLVINIANSLVLPNDNSQSKLLKFRPGVDLVQHDLRCQQFQTNIRILDSAPTLVGGATFPSASGEDQTYLIIEAFVNRN